MKSSSNSYRKEYSIGERAKHLRPYLKRIGNKRWRKSGKLMQFLDNEVSVIKKRSIKKTVKARVTKVTSSGKEVHFIKKFKTIKAAINCKNNSQVIKLDILKQ